MDLILGEKVLCVDATGYLAEGQIYTVESIFKQGKVINSITVNECDEMDGYKSYLVKREL